MVCVISVEEVTLSLIKQSFQPLHQIRSRNECIPAFKRSDHHYFHVLLTAAPSLSLQFTSKNDERGPELFNNFQGLFKKKPRKS